MSEPKASPPAPQFPQVAHGVGISGVPIFELSAMQHIRHLSTQLAEANEQVQMLRERVAAFEALFRAQPRAAQLAALTAPRDAHGSR